MDKELKKLLENAGISEGEGWPFDDESYNPAQQKPVDKADPNRTRWQDQPEMSDDEAAAALGEDDMSQGFDQNSAVIKVGKALGDRAYHDEMGGGQGGIPGLSSAAFVLSIVYDGDADAIEESLHEIATQEKSVAYQQRRGY